MSRDAMCRCGQALALGREAGRGEDASLCGSCNYERASVSGRTHLDREHRRRGEGRSPFDSAPAIGSVVPGVDDGNPWGTPFDHRTRTCQRCDMHPMMARDLCGACLGRELLGFASREQQAAAIKELFGRLSPEALAGLAHDGSAPE